VSRWRPTPTEERWLTVAEELAMRWPGETLSERSRRMAQPRPPRAQRAVRARVVAGGATGRNPPSGGEIVLLVSGLVAISPAEWLTVTRRCKRSGIEEGLGVAGSAGRRGIASISKPRTAFTGTSVTRCC